MVKRQKDDIVRKDVGQDYDKKKVLSLSKMNTERKWLNRGRKKGDVGVYVCCYVSGERRRRCECALLCEV